MSKASAEVYSALRRKFRGGLLRPGDSEYDGARRIWNGMAAGKPGLIALARVQV